MKFAIRAFALTVVLAGVAGAAVTSSSASSAKHPASPSRQAAMDTMPVPVCVPGIPTCPKRPTTAQ